MGRRISATWLRLALLKSLLIFTVAAGADVNQFDRNGGRGRGDNDGGNAEGGIGGGPRDGGGNHGGNQGGGHGGNNGGGNGGGRGDHGGGRGDNADGGWGDDGDWNNGNDRGGRGDHDGRGGRGDHGGNRPDPNPYDPNPGNPGRDPRYPDSPCQRDPRRCPPGNGGWQTERTVYVNQVFQQQYVDLQWLAGGVIGTMWGYGLVGMDVEILNQWGPSTLRFIVNNQQVDAQNVFNRYVSLRSFRPIDLNPQNRVFLGVQGRVHVGSVTLHFQNLGRR